MDAFLENGEIWAPYSPKLERRGFGKRKGDRIILSIHEAIYLSTKGSLRVLRGEEELSPKDLLKMLESPSYYFAYEDLRERGHRIKPDGRYFTWRDKEIIAFSEREKIRFPELKDFTGIIAVVDEEGEVTYYHSGIVEPLGKQKEELMSFSGTFIGDRVLTTNTEIYKKYFYGSERNNVVTLSLVEAVYLAEKGCLQLDEEPEIILKKARKLEKNFERKYEVYRDLKERNFVVKTGFKFGSDFRVYERVESLSDLPHSKYLIKIVDDEPFDPSEVAGMVRLAQNVRKRILFVFEAEDRNFYYLLERIRV
jgi:tRNA-intron endonuclease